MGSIYSRFFDISCLLTYYLLYRPWLQWGQLPDNRLMPSPPTCLPYLDTIIVEILYDIAKLHSEIGSTTDNVKNDEMMAELATYHHELDDTLKKKAVYDGIVAMVENLRC